MVVRLMVESTVINYHITFAPYTPSRLNLNLRASTICILLRHLSICAGIAHVSANMRGTRSISKVVHVLKTVINRTMIGLLA